ncbi:hypothetical protein Tco_0908235 [Tanacetum coccineum]|uniref:Uncharacterized protein n=1 Tax=Tanacetum coccineum TaxID=301880 RepID=A0ABQ5CLJ7_9ASTR
MRFSRTLEVEQIKGPLLFFSKSLMSYSTMEEAVRTRVRTSSMFFSAANAETTSNIDGAQGCISYRRLSTMLPHECKTLWKGRLKQWY